jgi:hypothetical protein
MDKRAPQRQHFQNEAKRAEDLKLNAKRTAQLTDFENTVIDGFNALIKFMNGKTTKTEVVNQLKSISTPDVDKVVTAVSKLDKDILANKLDMQPLVKELQQIKREMSLVPKSLPKFEQKDSVKVTNLSEVKFDTTRLEQLVKELKLDPTIDVKAPIVNVDAPNLKPLQDLMLDLLKAVGKIELDVPETDLKTLEKQSADTNKKLDLANKKLQQIVDKPVGGGSGGGGNGTPYINAEGAARNVQLTPNGAIPVDLQDTSITVTSSPLALRLDDTTTSNVTYVGKAATGSSNASAVWQIQKIDETSGLVITWADNGNFSQIWNDRVGLAYL